MFCSHGCASVGLHTVFDAERSSPELIEQIAVDVPQIREVVVSLRESLPVVPNSRVGPLGRGDFYRLPNHYRSISYMLPPSGGDDQDSIKGVIVFKGTEPLIPDFPDYLDWMLGAPFRASALPMGLHFPLDMKLPPAAMWIEECKAEQAVATRVQQQFLGRFGRLARLPVPLFVLQMTQEQLDRYEAVVRTRLSSDALWKIRGKLKDGLGVEVYYYPELPVRVADLFVGNVREAFKGSIAPDRMEATFAKWTQLLAEMLCLGYMPYVPWHHGMGGCVDSGNVCIDGGFNDLLTLVPFDAIPNEVLFRRSLQSSIQLLGESMASMAAAASGLPGLTEPDAGAVAAAHVTEQLRRHILSIENDGQGMDARLKKFIAHPAASDILDAVKRSHRGRGQAAQFVGQAMRPSVESQTQEPETVVAS